MKPAKPGTEIQGWGMGSGGVGFGRVFRASGLERHEKQRDECRGGCFPALLGTYCWRESLQPPGFRVWGLGFWVLGLG